ncbi:sigma factor-like helix-turn-helix DNA-binding protein (plasmid) [Halopseudomonas sp. SMJS2]|uniref:sigma factor-like helix-turn-helix DNA-binding protein n=1 Tax=Halopseudomonas sp. SMJS2 TaxID=3041098 RepID=UPI0024531F7E|nr:sigma factor-like helix-turn-helix DNA-binding protein [Halopseudomonas sp. SMJS2]WGK63394.1 sigma factor-like helix-turn-helix DNA-binding protein [Halopseudomonas sp. SMJS2]
MKEATQAKNQPAAEATAHPGFSLCLDLPPLPDLQCTESSSHDRNCAMAVRIHLLSSKLMALLSCDTQILERLVDRVVEASHGDIERSADLVCVDGLWQRIGSVPAEEFSLLIQRKALLIKSQIAEVRAIGISADTGDLFRMAATARLTRSASEFIPYDLLLNSSLEEFRARCLELEVGVREIANFAARSLRISYRQAREAGHGLWGSPVLYSSLVKAAGYEYSLCPAKTKRAFRSELISMQTAVVHLATGADVPVNDMLWCWDNFRSTSRLLDETLGRFATANRGLVEKAVWNYSSSGDPDSIRSAAQLGLVRAMRRFAPEKGWKFSTYATTWIQQCILRDLGMKDVIRLPEGSHKALGTLSHLLKDKPNASDAWLAEKSGLSRYEVQNLMYFVNQRSAVSMDSLMVGDASDAGGVHEHISDPNNNFIDDLIEEDTAAFVLDTIRQVLSDKELAILTARFGLGNASPRTLKELADEYSLSPERIRQIEVQAVKKLRDSDLAEALMELQ